jgi:hypothetical protein
MFMTCFGFTLVILGESFHSAMQDAKTFDLSYFKAAEEQSFMASQLTSSVEIARKNGSLLACFAKEVSVPDTIQNAYSEALAGYFSRPAFSSREVQDLYHLLTRPPTPELTSTQQLTEEMLLGLKGLVVRRKKEITDLLVKR